MNLEFFQWYNIDLFANFTGTRKPRWIPVRPCLRRRWGGSKTFDRRWSGTVGRVRGWYEHSVSFVASSLSGGWTTLEFHWCERSWRCSISLGRAPMSTAQVCSRSPLHNLIAGWYFAMPVTHWCFLSFARRGIPAGPLLSGYCGPYEVGMELSMMDVPQFSHLHWSTTLFLTLSHSFFYLHFIFFNIQAAVGLMCAQQLSKTASASLSISSSTCLSHE